MKEELSHNLQELWRELLAGVKAPDDGQWALWLHLHDREVVEQGIIKLAVKYRRLGGEMAETYMLKFASSVMNRLTREKAETASSKDRDHRSTVPMSARL